MDPNVTLPLPVAGDVSGAPNPLGAPLKLAQPPDETGPGASAPQPPPARPQYGLEPGEPTGLPTFQSGEQEAQVQPSGWEKLLSLVKGTSEHSLVGFVPGHPGIGLRKIGEWQVNTASEMNGEPKISPEDAKKYYGIDVTDPIVPFLALSRAKQKFSEQRMADWVSRGGDPSTVMRFAAGLSGAVDPSNLLAGAAVGAAVAEPLVEVASAGAARVFAKQAPASLAKIYAENLAAISTTEIPAHLLEQSQGEAPPLADRVESIAASALIGTGVHLAVRRLLSRDHTEALVRQGIAEHEAGRPITAGPGMAEIEQRRSGIDGDGYEFRQYRDLRTEPKWHAAVKSGESIPSHVGWDIPGTVDLVDRPSAANGVAANPEGMIQGKVIWAGPNERANLIEGSDPISQHPELLGEINSRLKEHGLEYTPGKTIPEGSTVKDVIDAAHFDSLLAERGHLNRVVPFEERLAAARALDPAAFRMQDIIDQELGGKREAILQDAQRIAEIDRALKAESLTREEFDRLTEEEKVILGERTREQFDATLKKIEENRVEYAGVQERISNAFLQAQKGIEAKTPESGNAILEAVKEALKAQGVDGVHYIHEMNGEPRYHGLLMLDRDQLQTIETKSAEPAAVYRTPAPDRVGWSKDLQDPRLSAVNASIDKRIGELRNGKAVKEAIEQTEAYQGFLDKKLDALASENPKLKDQIQKLREEIARDKQTAQALSDYADCTLQVVK